MSNTRRRRRTGSSPPPLPPPTDVFAAILEGADQFTKAATALDAECIASSLVGMWHRMPTVNRLLDIDVDAYFGQGLALHAARHPSTDALALLLALAAVSESHVAATATAGAEKLRRGGVPEPAWAPHVGRVTCTGGWAGSDYFGNQDVLLLAFSHGDGRPDHGVSVLVDHGLGGLAKDTFIASPASRLVASWEENADSGAPFSFDPTEPEEVAEQMLAAFATTDAVLNPPVSESFATDRALALARARAILVPQLA
jgi:hypothetical protein